MRLSYSAASPYVRKVMITLRELGAADSVTPVPTTGSVTEPSAERIAMNPLGKVPALERDEGPTLYDSRVICRYLNDRFDGRLYPEGEALWDALVLEATADGITDALVAMVYEGRLRPAEKQHEPWVEGMWRKASDAMNALERQWMAHLSGPFDAAQIALSCALEFADRRFADRNWREGRPQLAAWYEKVSQRPSVSEPMPGA